MNAVLRHPIALGFALLLGLILVAATFAVVPEQSQAVVYRLEQPLRTVNGHGADGESRAGLIARIPFVDRVVYIDKRVLDLDLENTLVLSTDQRRLNVDAFARYRIVDPLRMLATTGGNDGLVAQMGQIFGAELRNELGRRSFAALLSPERGQVMDAIQRRLQAKVRRYGVEIVDVRIKRADLPAGSPLQSALDRMATQREQEAAAIRADGTRRAQIVQAEADARAAQIYAASFGKDPEFYDFYRAMQSYRMTFGIEGNPQQPSGSTSFVLSPDNSYLRQFRGGAGR